MNRCLHNTNRTRWTIPRRRQTTAAVEKDVPCGTVYRNRRKGRVVLVVHHDETIRPFVFAFVSMDDDASTINVQVVGVAHIRNARPQ